MVNNELYAIAEAMMTKGKGLLAADESNKSVPKRLDPIKVESTPENRRRFRELYLSCPGAEQYMSGVILYDETLRQSDSNGTPFPKVLADRGIVPGIKVDAGAKDLQNFPGEKLTEGLDGLADRLKEYHGLGARFAKWRGVINIGKGIPTQEMIDANAFVLAIYALRCQEAGIVPMVEPEVVLKGSHTIEKAEQVTTNVLKACIAQLKKYKADLKGTIVKTSMVVPGSESGQPMNPDQVGEATARCLRASIPEETGGVVFLSGGQTSDQATANLNAVAKHGPFPWNVTFTFARALQYPAIEIWAGKDENIGKAREAFMERLRANAAASIGSL
jgi:fructose-bisphosphate aldolase class I